MQLVARLPGRSIGMTARSRSVFSRAAAFGLFLPGLAQLGWGQHVRGLVFLGSFVSALCVSILCWGDPLGWGFLVFTFVTHAASSLDVVKQRSFPSYPRFLAIIATLGWLGMTAYLPLGAAAALFALPARSDGPAGAGYLVNCLAYRSTAPQHGHCVWIRLSPVSPPRAGRVLAIAGQEVRWESRRWLVDQKPIELTSMGHALNHPDRYSFRVPEHHLLVGLENDTSRNYPCGSLILVSHEQVIGRVWARCSPFWDRCLL